MGAPSAPGGAPPPPGEETEPQPGMELVSPPGGGSTGASRGGGRFLASMGTSPSGGGNGSLAHLEFDEGCSPRGGIEWLGEVLGLSPYEVIAVFENLYPVVGLAVRPFAMAFHSHEIAGV